MQWTISRDLKIYHSNIYFYRHKTTHIDHPNEKQITNVNIVELLNIIDKHLGLNIIHLIISKGEYLHNKSEQSKSLSKYIIRIQ